MPRLVLPRLVIPRPSAALALGALGVSLAGLRAVVDVDVLTAPLFAVAVALGAAVPGKKLARLLPLVCAAGVGALARTESAADVVAFGLCFFGFGALGRGLLFATLRFVVHREQARTDQHILKIHDDARMLRLLGATGTDHDAAASDTLVARTLAAKDAAYRLLHLGARALRADAAALYVVNRDTLEKMEQALLVDDLELEPRLSPKTGACGLALQKGRAVRLVGADAARAHRKNANAVLVVPVPDGVVIFDRTQAAPFDDVDEATALALAAELGQALQTERVLVDLDDERRRTTRVFAAARAFSGVVRLDEALDQTLAVARDLAPRASVAVVVVERLPGQPPVLFVARATTGDGELPLAEGERFALDEGSWVGRAFVQKSALPHDAHTDVALHGLYSAGDRRTRTFGDLLVVPLSSHGDVGALLVVAVPEGERLRVRTRRALDVLGDIAGTAIGGAKLFFTVEQRATTDGLTGLVNRRTLDEKLNQGIARARRTKVPLAVLLCDVDHFKSVNDTYGHAAGDQVLVGIAKALAQTARTTDVVARYGGEEMCLVLEGTDIAGAVRLAERMRLAIKGLRFETDKGPLSVTTSFGVALLHDTEDALAVRERADAALYRAKRAGRDRVVLDAADASTGPGAASVDTSRPFVA